MIHRLKIGKEELAAALEDHSDWLASGGKRGVKAELSFHDLSGKRTCGESPFAAQNRVD